MLTLILVLHIAICFLIIFLVLLQTGKAVDMGSLVGSTKQSFFDTSGVGSFLNKATTVVAIFFIFTSLTIGYLNNKKEEKIIVDNRAQNIVHCTGQEKDK